MYDTYTVCNDDCNRHVFNWRRYILFYHVSRCIADNHYVRPSVSLPFDVDWSCANDFRRNRSLDGRTRFHGIICWMLSNRFDAIQSVSCMAITSRRKNFLCSCKWTKWATSFQQAISLRRWLIRSISISQLRTVYGHHIHIEYRLDTYILLPVHCDLCVHRLLENVLARGWGETTWMSYWFDTIS